MNQPGITWRLEPFQLAWQRLQQERQQLEQQRQRLEQQEPFRQQEQLELVLQQLVQPARLLLFCRKLRVSGRTGRRSRVLFSWYFL
jgi:hypothetical protein